MKIFGRTFISLGIVLTVMAPALAFSQSAMYLTSGGGRTGASAAKLSAMQTVQQRHMEAIRDCTNIGKLYAPAAAEADAQGCIATANPCGDAGMLHGPNFEASLVDSFGCVQTVKSNYAVDGSEAETNVQILDFVKARHIVDGVDETRVLEIAANVEALPPVENNHAATKEYVDTVLAAGGGGGGAPMCGTTRRHGQLFTGNLGGLEGADALCEDEFGAGWRMATMASWTSGMRTSSGHPGADRPWIWSYYRNCNGYTTLSNGVAGARVRMTSTSIGYEVQESACGQQAPVACCNF